MVSPGNNLNDSNPPLPGSGIERTGMLDAFAHDTREDVLILAMFETRAWDLGERQLWQLQEKLNAYVSFILDGEMRDTFPHLAGKPVRIELRTVYQPPERAMGFLGRARDQLALQQIALEVVLIEEDGRHDCCDHGGGDCCDAGKENDPHGHGHHAHGERGHCHQGGCGCGR